MDGYVEWGKPDWKRLLNEKPSGHSNRFNICHPRMKGELSCCNDETYEHMRDWSAAYSGGHAFLYYNLKSIMEKPQAMTNWIIELMAEMDVFYPEELDKLHLLSPKWRSINEKYSPLIGALITALLEPLVPAYKRAFTIEMGYLNG